jgi:hypothetical protein
MNILYSTMGSYFKVFYHLNMELNDSLTIVPSFYISDKNYIEKTFKKDFLQNLNTIKEWDLINNGLQSKLVNERLIEIQKTYFGDESIWRSIINDRRLYNGTYCKYKQDYFTKFKEEELLKIFQYSFDEIEKHIKKTEPDCVIGPIPTTIGEYLIFRIAKKKNIKTLIFRHTKIKNYYSFLNNLNEVNHEVDSSILEKNFSDKNFNEAKNYIHDFKLKKGVLYEGTIKRDNYFFKAIFTFLSGIPKNFIKEYFIKPFKKNDLHSRGNEFYKNYLFYLKPYLNNFILKLFHKNYFSSFDSIEKKKFIYFPLHSEPEIAITFLSKGYYNQIELIREISFNLPAGYCLVVNEHPRNKARRSISYYKSISKIPNVYLADFEIKSHDLINLSSLVIVLSGFIGFESLILKKPVICFGKTNYSRISHKMIKFLPNLNKLYNESIDSLESFKHEEDKLISFIASVISHSEPINFYSVLLNKNRVNFKESSQDFHLNIESLAKLTTRKIFEKDK